MKVYQIHEIGGQYENYYNDIVGSYECPNRMQQELERLIKNEQHLFEHGEKCAHCPITNGCKDMTEAFSAVKDYCSEHNLKEYNGHIYCNNYLIVSDRLTYKADVIEVEEKCAYWIHTMVLNEDGTTHHQYRCMNCGRVVERETATTIEDIPYCHCGTKMRIPNEGCK